MLPVRPETGAKAEARVLAYAATHPPQEARCRFRVVVETELANLHEGNFARYRIRPSEFALWKESIGRIPSNPC